MSHISRMLNDRCFSDFPYSCQYAPDLKINKVIIGELTNPACSLPDNTCVEYAYILYTDAAGPVPQTVTAGSDVLFNTNSILTTNLLHSITLNTQNITINKVGVYEITFILQIEPPAVSTVQEDHVFAITVNGVVNNQAIYTTSLQNTTAHTSLTGTAIINALAPGTIVTLRNIGPTDTILTRVVGTIPVVSASVKINNLS